MFVYLRWCPPLIVTTERTVVVTGALFRLCLLAYSGTGQLVVDLVGNAAGERHSICIDRESLFERLAVAQILPPTPDLFRRGQSEPPGQKGGHHEDQGGSAPLRAGCCKHTGEDDAWRLGRGGLAPEGAVVDCRSRISHKGEAVEGDGDYYDRDGELNRSRERGSSYLSIVSTSACTKDSCSGSSAHSEVLLGECGVGDGLGEGGEGSSSSSGGGGVANAGGDGEGGGVSQKRGEGSHDARPYACSVGSSGCYLNETPPPHTKEEGKGREELGSSGRGRKDDEKKRLEELVRSMQMELSRLTAEVRELSCQQEDGDVCGAGRRTSKGLRGNDSHFLHG